MRYAEAALAVVLAAVGVRRLVASLRERFDGADVGDHLLYAMHVTGRVGIWFAFAGILVLIASIDVEGRALIDEFTRYRYWFMLPVTLAAMRFVGGQLLARRSPKR